MPGVVEMVIHIRRVPQVKDYNGIGVSEPMWTNQLQHQAQVQLHKIYSLQIP